MTTKILQGGGLLGRLVSHRVASVGFAAVVGAMSLPAQYTRTPGNNLPMLESVPFDGGSFTAPGRRLGSPEVFKPMRAVPSLFMPPSYNTPHASSVVGFSDPGASNGSGVEREYFLVGRGDGMFLIDVTPPATAGAQCMPSDIAGTAADPRLDFMQNPNVPVSFTPPVDATPPNAIYTPWSDCGVLQDPQGDWWAYGSNGGQGTYVNAWAGLAPQGLWVVPLVRSGPSGALRFDRTSPNARWMDPDDQYGGSTIKIPPIHNMTVDPKSGLIFICTNSLQQPLPPNPPIPYSACLFVLSTRSPASCASPRILQILYHQVMAGGLNLDSDHAASPHGVFIKDGKVYLSHIGNVEFPQRYGANPPLPIACYDEYRIADFNFGIALHRSTTQPPLSSPMPTRRLFGARARPASLPTPLDNPTAMQHGVSCYVDGMTIWMLEESIAYQRGWLDAAPSAAQLLGRANFQAGDLGRDLLTGQAPASSWYQPWLANGQPTTTNTAPRLAWEAQQRDIRGFVALPLQPSQTGSPPFQSFDPATMTPHPMNPGLEMFAQVHHLRGVHKTAFAAHWVDGLDLVDLSDPALGMQMLGSFDLSSTTMLTGWQEFPFYLATLGPQYGNFLHTYGGVFDVSPQNDSGLVCAAAGREGAVIFRVGQGHVNRYWQATPMPAAAQVPGYYPSVAAESGPLRPGRPFRIRDGNRKKKGPGLRYRYELIVNLSPPTSAPTNPGPRGYFENVAAGAVYGPQEDDEFTFPASVIPPSGVTVYVQMVCEEVWEADSGDLMSFSPPRFSASRGAWIGVCAL